MSQSQNSHPEKDVAKVFYQLDFYLQALQLPLRAKDLYRRVYQSRLGEYYDESWLDQMDQDWEMKKSLNEPFTVQTIVETLMHSGHEAIVRALIREMRRRDIGFSQAYIMGMNHHQE